MYRQNTIGLKPSLSQILINSIARFAFQSCSMPDNRSALLQSSESAAISLLLSSALSRSSVLPVSFSSLSDSMRGFRSCCPNISRSSCSSFLCCRFCSISIAAAGLDITPRSNASAAQYRILDERCFEPSLLIPRANSRISR